jgi:NAD(P)-dependent dehydrogenase (short-subunit alcohol dehydrogenase family)
MSIHDFDGKTVLVTGAASGIGRATARRFGSLGGSVIVTDRRVEEGNATVASIRDHCGDAEFRELDVTDSDRFRSLASAIESEYGRLDILVNNAGVLRLSEFTETSDGEADIQIAVNFEGVWNGCRAAVPVMRGGDGGAIINVASVDGLLGAAYHAPYGAAKAGVINLTRSLAVELGDEGIRINAVCPGYVATPHVEEHLSSFEDPAAKRAAIADETALDRLAEPDEIADCITFLASDTASYLTGENLVADAGYRYAREAHFRP